MKIIDVTISTTISYNTKIIVPDSCNTEEDYLKHYIKNCKTPARLLNENWGDIIYNEDDLCLIINE